MFCPSLGPKDEQSPNQGKDALAMRAWLIKLLAHRELTCLTCASPVRGILNCRASPSRTRESTPS